MDKKYEILNDDYIIFNGHKLFRIRALKDFQTIHGLMVNIGDLGGYIQSEKNLSQNGNRRVYDNAKVFGNACVYDDAKVYDNACVCENAQVFGFAVVCDNTEVSGGTLVQKRSDV